MNRQRIGDTLPEARPEAGGLPCAAHDFEVAKWQEGWILFLDACSKSPAQFTPSAGRAIQDIGFPLAPLASHLQEVYSIQDDLERHITSLLNNVALANKEVSIGGERLPAGIFLSQV